MRECCRSDDDSESEPENSQPPVDSFGPVLTSEQTRPQNSQVAPSAPPASSNVSRSQYRRKEIPVAGSSNEGFEMSNVAPPSYIESMRH